MAKKLKGKPPVYFREWRDHKGLTQEQAAERADLAQETISKLERRKIDFTEESLFALAHAYGCEPGDLFRPPVKHPNELAAFVMALDDERRQQRALRLLKAAMDDEDEGQAA